MAAKPKTLAKGKSKLDIGGALTRKFGPLPAWAYLLIVGGAVYWWRHRSSSTGAASTTTTADDGGGFGGSFTPTDGGGGGGGSSDAGTPDTPVTPGSSTVPDSTNDGAGTGSSPSSNPSASPAAKAKAAAATPGATSGTVVAGQSVNPDAVARAFSSGPTAPIKAAETASATPAFGGVKSTVVKNGTTITTYGSGRVVEQAKGKSAYVAHK